MASTSHRASPHSGFCHYERSEAIQLRASRLLDRHGATRLAMTVRLVLSPSSCVPLAPLNL